MRSMYVMRIQLLSTLDLDVKLAMSVKSAMLGSPLLLSIMPSKYCSNLRWYQSVVESAQVHRPCLLFIAFKSHEKRCRVAYISSRRKTFNSLESTCLSIFRLLLSLPSSLRFGIPTMLLSSVSVIL
jgi:hypothetical protein